jgi:hypothetical protein
MLSAFAALGRALRAGLYSLALTEPPALQGLGLRLRSLAQGFRERPAVALDPAATPLLRVRRRAAPFRRRRPLDGAFRPQAASLQPSDGRAQLKLHNAPRLLVPCSLQSLSRALSSDC